ncbi:BRCT domain-containing protein, partial [Salmonella sp. s51228]|uniref:BRCT domain-containing protein n=1 Tax=Salmonella sp. s51228 TaxID=3159652 RepID=UPI00397FED6F
ISNISVTPNTLFLISSVLEKTILYQIIEQLGGTYIDSERFELRCTHVIAGQIEKNEKILCAIASGGRKYFE